MKPKQRIRKIFFLCVMTIVPLLFAVLKFLLLTVSHSSVPVAVVFNPNWWFRNHAISFDRSFYFHPQERVENDVKMRQVLYDRFGFGEPNPKLRPIIGSRHVAGGFVVPALLGVEVRFSESQAPWPVPMNLDRKQILALKVPEIEKTWPMNELIASIDRMEKEFGFVIGDFNTDGVLNTALQLRGQQLFLDLIEDPELVHHLFSVVAEVQVRVASYVKSRTGTSSVATNRSILNVNPAIYLHSNCSVQMISPALYEQRLLLYERFLSARLQPYGIHHCGSNLHLFANAYSQLPAIFYDAGWGSDIVRCSQAFPEAFLNLRLSPVRMLQQSPDEIKHDTETLLRTAARSENVGVCCINMDHGTPDENVMAMIHAAQQFVP
jgi:uroporphyrinogen-III decarboxylase